MSTVFLPKEKRGNKNDIKKLIKRLLKITRLINEKDFQALTTVHFNNEQGGITSLETNTYIRANYVLGRSLYNKTKTLKRSIGSVNLTEF